jgi:hypothetical protein
MIPPPPPQDESKTELSTPENSTTRLRLLDSMAPNDDGAAASSLSLSLENKEEEDLDLEQGTKNASVDENASAASSQCGAPSVPPKEEEVYDDIDEDHTYIEIPVPGLHLLNPPRPLRQAPNICSICLCNYEVGSDVVWSSNQACDHVFHEQCIEQWLMKQREGPLCPCCRRDFILDPYDLEEGEEEVDPQLLAYDAYQGLGLIETMETPLEATTLEETPPSTTTSSSMDDQRIATMEEQPTATTTEVEEPAASQIILSEAPPPMGDEATILNETEV